MDAKWDTWEKALGNAPDAAEAGSVGVEPSNTQTATPTAYTDSACVVSAAVVGATVLLLWILRPPFIMSKCATGLSIPQVRWYRVLMIALVLGALVLGAPHARTVLVNLSKKKSSLDHRARV